jgi:fatty-acyl-CoA synthase
MAEGDPACAWQPPGTNGSDLVNYTSGTTGNPKGVYHHRGAYLNARPTSSTGDAAAFGYLWTLPLFHCNGWCFAWMVGNAGTNVCLRKVEAQRARRDPRARVTHYCGCRSCIDPHQRARGNEAGTRTRCRAVASCAAGPMIGHGAPGFDITHVYGLTETYGYACAPSTTSGSAGHRGAHRAQRPPGVRYTARRG